MLFGFHLHQFQRRALLQVWEFRPFFQSIFTVVRTFNVDLHETGEAEHSPTSSQHKLICSNMHDSLIQLRRTHLTCHEPFPYQFVKCQLIFFEIWSHLLWGPRHRGWPDGLVSILGSFTAPVHGGLLGNILCPTIVQYPTPSRCHRLLGKSGGICPHIGYETHSSLFAQLNPFV